MMLPEESAKLDKAVKSVLTYTAELSGNNPQVIRLVLQECLHKLDMISVIKNKLGDLND